MKSSSDGRLKGVLKLVRQLGEDSANGNDLFRGERECCKKASTPSTIGNQESSPTRPAGRVPVGIAAAFSTALPSATRKRSSTVPRVGE